VTFDLGLLEINYESSTVTTLAVMASYGPTRCGQHGRWMAPDVVTVDARGSATMAVTL